MKFKIRYALKTIFAICGIMATVGLASGCGSSDAKEKPQTAVVRPVKAIQLSQAPSVRKLRLPGVANAVRDTDLAFRVGGPLIALHVDTGAYVKKGQIVAEVDPRDFQIRVKTGQAKLNSSMAQLAETKLQYDRYAKLIKQKAVAQAEYDSIKAAYEVAQAQELSSKKALEDAKNALADTVLKAPFDGYIDERFVDNHETINTGQPVASLVDLSSMEVKLALSENLLPLAKRFSSFTCSFDALPGQSFAATIKEIGQKADSASRTYPLILTLEKSAQTIVRPGMSAEVSATLNTSEESDGFLVPLTALYNRGGQDAFVWVVNGKTGTLSRIKVDILGLRDGGAKIRGKLAAGQWIVTAGVNHLREDLIVRLLAKPSKTNIGVEM